MRILEVVTNLDGGGVDRLMYDYCCRMTPAIHFDFITVADEEHKGILESPLKALGCSIFRVVPMRQNIGKHLKQVHDIIRKGNYDAIHTHGNYKNIDCLFIAWYLGVKRRIAHSHIAFIPESKKETFARRLLVPITKLLATKLYACGEDAAVWMWGERAYKTGKVRIMVNAIDTQKFVFSEEKREKLRREIGVHDKYVVGSVARLSYQKNHEFLINVFKEFKKTQESAVLMLVGQGELEEELREQIRELNMERDVIFLGVRSDVADLLNAMDVFVLPSRFEGLGIVYIEAQANGLYSYASEGVVPKAANAGKMLTYLPLSKGPKYWAQELMKAKQRLHEDNSHIIRKAGYDIETAALEQMRMYLEM